MNCQEKNNKHIRITLTEEKKMQYLLSAGFMALLLMTGISTVTAGGWPQDKEMRHEAGKGLNNAMQRGNGVIGFDNTNGNDRLTITPNNMNHPTSNPMPHLERPSMPEAAGHGLSDNPSSIIDFGFGPDDYTLTISPPGIMGGPGNPGFGPGQHPGKRP
jgi:hypothetical protein